MITVYDKVSWHIDAGEDEKEVIARISNVLTFLGEKKLLTDEGIELLEFVGDSSMVIHERMLTNAGNEFMKKCYDKVIDKTANTIKEALNKEYSSMQAP